VCLYLPVDRVCRDRFVHCVVHAPISWRRRRPGISFPICVLYWRCIWYRHLGLSCSSVAAHHDPPVGICVCCASARRTTTHSRSTGLAIHRACFNRALRTVFTACNARPRLLAESHGHGKWCHAWPGGFSRWACLTRHRSPRSEERRVGKGWSCRWVPMDG